MNKNDLIEEHINMLINKYDFRFLYKKYIILSIVSGFLYEMFYWLLLLFNNIIKENIDLVKLFSTILFSLLLIFIPIDNWHSKVKATLLEKIRIANCTYYLDKIIKLNKYDILNINLVKYIATIDNLSSNIEEYIINIKVKYDIPIKFITLIIISINKKYILIVFIFIIYFFIVVNLNENKIKNDSKSIDKYFTYNEIIKNYIINSKSFLINNELNQDYLHENINILESINKDRTYNSINLESKIDVLTFLFIFIVICNKLQNINVYDFLTYFLLIYDIQHVSDRIILYYRNKVNIPKMVQRIDYLNSFIVVNKKNIENIDNNMIIINNINNTSPKLICNKQIFINKNDHYLIDGKSGSGKTTFLYIFKGIMTPDKLDINPNIESLIDSSYLILPNNKDLYNGNLYDIISNYSKEPDINLINKSLEIAYVNYVTDNDFINIESLSSGEKIRLVLARSIYSIITNNYKILLFDEIDENLDDELAYNIRKNVRKYFKNYIILYITHNNRVKTLFNKKIYIKDGTIA